jgi:hypothetical protein
MISRRTKDALAAAKRRGVKLGGYRAGSKLTALYASRDCRVTGGRRYVIAGRRSGPERPWDTNRARYRSLVCDAGLARVSAALDANVAIGGTVCAVCPAPTIPSSARQARSCEMSLLVVRHQQRSDDADASTPWKNRDLRQVPDYGHIAAAAILNMVHPLLPARNIPAFPTFPETEPGRRRTGECGERVGKISP